MSLLEKHVNKIHGDKLHRIRESFTLTGYGKIKPVLYGLLYKIREMLSFTYTGYSLLDWFITQDSRVFILRYRIQ